MRANLGVARVAGSYGGVARVAGSNNWLLRDRHTRMKAELRVRL